MLDKRFSEQIEIVRRQYSGNACPPKAGAWYRQRDWKVNCIYVNPKTLQFWVIDYRIFNPDNDGLSKVDLSADRQSSEKKVKLFRVAISTDRTIPLMIILYIFISCQFVENLKIIPVIGCILENISWKFVYDT